MIRKLEDAEMAHLAEMADAADTAGEFAWLCVTFDELDAEMADRPAKPAAFHPIPAYSADEDWEDWELYHF